ncbi:MAG: peptidylprolyl isomerase [Agarilytica sp.]
MLAKSFIFTLGLVFALGTSAAEEKKTAKNETPKVLFETSIGDILIELYPKEAPITVENFLKYIDDGFYNGVIFHRVVPGFVVQAGGYTFDFQRKETRNPIKNESDNGLKNTIGTLSMARTNVINSATSQFFINLRNNSSLDFGKGHGYAVFGKVIDGFKVVKTIEKAPRGMFRVFPEAPNEAIIIEKAARVSSDTKKVPERKNEEKKKAVKSKKETTK